MAAEPAGTRSAFLWVGAVMLVVMVATVTAFLIVVLLGDDDADPPASEATAEATVEPMTVVGGQTVRSGPASNTAIAGRLEDGAEVLVLGASTDGGWVYVEAVDDASLSGWVRIGSVNPPPDPQALTVIAPGASPTPFVAASPTAVATSPTFTPDLPDLRVASVFSRDNRVTVVVENAGVVDVAAQILVSVDGGDLVASDVKEGEPLRPDQQLEITLGSEYVQRRALISAAVTTDPAIEESNLENNELETVIAPDLPNDLGIESAAFDGAEGALRVVLVNNSPIPVEGAGTLTVREASDARTRLGVEQPSFVLEPGATMEVEFPEIVGLTLEEITIRWSSNAVNDEDASNDVFPR